GLEETGFPACLAAAATPRAALWRARSEGRALEEVPLEAACSGEPLEFLQSLGLRTVGELQRLPREGLARRCGPALLHELDQAFGAAPEARVFFEPPPRFAAKM